ncbi:MAG: hypothetical protein GDA36_12175, partial [Rhodobacteraceae bacterium]|nr:hypothetical protein [Paracoccaceae bacterium]
MRMCTVSGEEFQIEGFGGSVDLAILSGFLALHRVKHQAKRFWWLGYAIAGVCGAGSARLPPA